MYWEQNVSNGFKLSNVVETIKQAFADHVHKLSGTVGH